MSIRSIGTKVTYKTKSESGSLDLYSNPPIVKSGAFITFDLEFDCKTANLLSKKSSEGEMITLTFDYPNGGQRVIYCMVNSVSPGYTDSKFIVEFKANRAQL